MTAKKIAAQATSLLITKGISMVKMEDALNIMREQKMLPPATRDELKAKVLVKQKQVEWHMKEAKLLVEEMKVLADQIEKISDE